MEAKIIVKGEKPKKQVMYASSGPVETGISQWIILALAAMALVISISALTRKGHREEKAIH